MKALFKAAARKHGCLHLLNVAITMTACIFLRARLWFSIYIIVSFFPTQVVVFASAINIQPCQQTKRQVQTHLEPLHHSLCIPNTSEY